jgi:hypothetical protein
MKEGDMSAATVRVKNDELTVESSDLLKASHDSKAKEFLKIQQYLVGISMGINGFKQRSSIQDAAVEMAAKREAKKIEDELVNLVKNLVKDLEKLQKEDQAGNKKAEEEANKRVKATSDKIEDTLPEFGRRIRKAVEQAVGQKLPSGIKTVGRGRFSGLILIGGFEGGGDSEFETAFATVAKSLGTFDNEVDKHAQAEKKAHEKLEDVLADALDDVKKYKDAVAKLRQEADKAAKTAAEAAAKAKAAKEDDRQAAEETAAKASQTAKEAKAKLNEFEQEYAKSLVAKSRGLREQCEAYGGQIEEYKKSVDTMLKAMETEHRKLLATATGQDKTALEQVKAELANLQKILGARRDSVERLAGDFKKFSASGIAAEWEPLVKRSLDAVKNLKPISSQKLAEALKKAEKQAKQ